MFCRLAAGSLQAGKEQCSHAAALAHWEQDCSFESAPQRGACVVARGPRGGKEGNGLGEPDAEERHRNPLLAILGALETLDNIIKRRTRRGRAGHPAEPFWHRDQLAYSRTG